MEILKNVYAGVVVNKQTRPDFDVYFSVFIDHENLVIVIVVSKEEYLD